MDQIQKILIEAGRKDLAQEYYKKTAKIREVKTAAGKEVEEFSNDKFEDEVKNIFTEMEIAKRVETSSSFQLTIKKGMPIATNELQWLVKLKLQRIVAENEGLFLEFDK